MKPGLPGRVKAVRPAQVVNVDVLEPDFFSEVIPRLLQVEAMGSRDPSPALGRVP